jgi:hypothetical protein
LKDDSDLSILRWWNTWEVRKEERTGDGLTVSGGQVWLEVGI